MVDRHLTGSHGRVDRVLQLPVAAHPSEIDDGPRWRRTRKAADRRTIDAIKAAGGMNDSDDSAVVLAGAWHREFDRAFTKAFESAEVCCGAMAGHCERAGVVECCPQVSGPRSGLTWERQASASESLESAAPDPSMELHTRCTRGVRLAQGDEAVVCGGYLDEAIEDGMHIGTVCGPNPKSETVRVPGFGPQSIAGGCNEAGTRTMTSKASPPLDR